jgi:colanic acid/amylovoran biosynthesis glycosyltransferase
MKVSYITMCLPVPSETFACNDVRTLFRAGVDVSVHSLHFPHKLNARLLEERQLANVPITHSSRAAIVRGLKAGMSRPRLLLDLLAWLVRHNGRKPLHLLKSLVLSPRALDLFVQIEEERPEVVHLFWGHHPSMVAHLVQKELPDIVVSVFLGAFDLEMVYGGSFPVARRADVVWTHAKANVETLKRFGIERERIRVAYRGVDMNRFRDANLPRDKIKRRIVAAATLIRGKGMDDALRAFARVLEGWPDASLVILGDGPERKRLEALARSLDIGHAVSFLGHVSHDRVFAELARAEAFLLMSKKPSERLPNAVKEAVGCRCLCVTTQTRGIEELLVDKEHGFIVALGDVEGAAERIGRAFADSSLVETMTEAAYRHLERNFDLEGTMRTYLEHWQRLALQKQAQRQLTFHAS